METGDAMGYATDADEERLWTGDKSKIHAVLENILARLTDLRDSVGHHPGCNTEDLYSSLPRVIGEVYEFTDNTITWLRQLQREKLSAFAEGRKAAIQELHRVLGRVTNCIFVVLGDQDMFTRLTRSTERVDFGSKARSLAKGLADAVYPGGLPEPDVN